jgi:hypothetical protein
MAITFIQQPQPLQPVYNPLYLVVDSSNKLEEGFRYIFKVKDPTTGDTIFTNRVAPEPNFGYGAYDFSKPLSDYLTWDLDLNNPNRYTTDNSSIRYNVDVSEEYVYSWDFNDTFFATGGITGLVGATAHNYVIGDQIYVKTDGLTSFNINGVYTILDVPNPDEVVINVTHQVTGTNSGNTTYADRRRIETGLTTSNTNYVFNGALSPFNFKSYDFNNYVIPGSFTFSNREFLTDQPTSFTVVPSAELWFSFFKALTDNTVINARFQNDKGNTYTKQAWLTSDGLNRHNMIGVGPSNFGTLTQIIGPTESLVQSDTLYYDVWLQSAGNPQITKKWRLYIDRRCKIFDWEILFLDRMGSFSTFAFSLRSEKSISVDRTSHNKVLGKISASGWSYDLTDSGETIYNVDLTEKYLLRSNFLTNENLQYFSQMFSSPLTYLKYEGEWVPCIIEDAGTQIENTRNRKLNIKEINVRLSNKSRINI